MTTPCSQQSTNDPNLPIDRQIVKDSIYFYLTGITDSELPEATLDTIIEKCIGKFEDSLIYDCDVTYCSLMSTLQYLIRKSWVSDGADSVGPLKRQREREGDIELESEWHITSGDSNENGWEKLYDYFLNNPSEICECLEVDRGNTFGLVSVGGTQKDKYEDNRYNPNSKTLWDTESIGNKFSNRREKSRRYSNQRSKYWSRY
ncbi:hypothetical protein vBVpaMR16F_133 [Vibrio phage vB_VpaM_R16F]|nr:hypothetical protein vBVpaMR16F_133 [Vibrio phage vB_VpaM_R16F]